jgi:hypothetical protein
MPPRPRKGDKALSRRQFIKTSTLTLGGAVVGGLSVISACSNKAETSNILMTDVTITKTVPRTVVTTAVQPSTVTVSSPPVTVTPEPAAISVMNPVGFPPPVQQRAMALRPVSLDGKKIYLIDVTFDDSDLFLQQVSWWFSVNMPQVTTEIRRKKGVYSTNDPVLWNEIKDNQGVAIMAIGH